MRRCWCPIDRSILWPRPTFSANNFFHCQNLPSSGAVISVPVWDQPKCLRKARAGAPTQAAGARGFADCGDLCGDCGGFCGGSQQRSVSLDSTRTNAKTLDAQLFEAYRALPSDTVELVSSTAVSRQVAGSNPARGAISRLSPSSYHLHQRRDTSSSAARYLLRPAYDPDPRCARTHTGPDLMWHIANDWLYCATFIFGMHLAYRLHSWT